MKIEKLKPGLYDLSDIDSLAKLFKKYGDKINEIIDSFNSSDQKNKTESDILHCPFCSREPHIIMMYDRCSIGCSNLKCILGNERIKYDTEENAIKAWNRRV